MPVPQNPQPPPLGSDGKPQVRRQTVADKARVENFRDKYLQRYPKSLRDAAQLALGISDVAAENVSTGRPGFDTAEAEQDLWNEREMYAQLRGAERKRVLGLMDDCSTDQELWAFMEKEVFSLPRKFGIIQQEESAKPKPKPKATKSKKKGKTAENELSEDSTNASAKPTEEAKEALFVHGPLYQEFNLYALKLFDTSFANPSPYIFQLLPRIKNLGLDSYVLGVSRQFLARLARIHWARFGDVHSALDMIQELDHLGLDPKGDVVNVLKRIRMDLQECSRGGQGPFVMAVMEASLKGGSGVLERVERMERYARLAVENSLDQGATDL